MQQNPPRYTGKPELKISDVEYLWATMYNFTRFPGGLAVNAAISGIEQALWDIAGKAASRWRTTP
jgi:L-alanine-DL-glutamate epimerase-like enolase superfamily enzyme